MGSVHGDLAAWKRLGTLARQRREALGLTQAELAQRARVATQTVLRFEQGNKPSRHSSSWSKLERALGWLPGSIDAVLEGGMPAEGSYDGTFLRVRLDDETEFVRDLVRKITFEVDPDTPLSRLMAAEAVAEAELRKRGLLPPIDDQEADASNSNE